MKKLNFYMKPLLLAGTFFLLMSCGGGDGPSDPPPPDPSRSIEDVVNDFENLTINEGTNDLQLESLVEGVFWKFRIIVPEGASDSNTRPLVLRLHGAARGNSPGAHQSTSCLVEPAFEGKDVFILSPNSNGKFWFEESNILQVNVLMELTMANLDVDTSKMVVTGYSDGGNGAWFYAQYYEQLFPRAIPFSAAIPLASSYNTATASGTVNKINVPLYVIHGEKDDLFPLEITRGFVQASIDAGSEITFVVAEGLVHNEPCAYEDEMEDAVDWLETEVW